MMSIHGRRNAVFVVPFCVIVFFQLTSPTVLAQRNYGALTVDQKREYIRARSRELLNGFGRKIGDDIDDAGIERIMAFVEGYVARKPVSRPARACGFGDDLDTVFRRGAAHAPIIVRTFELERVPANVGVSVAMLESEFCPCLQAPTGPLGLFQFTAITGQVYGLDTVKGADPGKPDERCNVRMASMAAARYLRKMMDDDFGRGSIGIPLSVAAYNSGEGSLKTRIKEMKEATGAPVVSFWTLSDFVANHREKWVEEKLKNAPANTDEYDLPNKSSQDQFISENIKYVPKFFAAAIIVADPRFFGINAEPLIKSK